MSISGPALLAALGEHRLLDDAQVRKLELDFPGRVPGAAALPADLQARGLLTALQADYLLAGRGHELTLGPYVLLERLGEGGMGQVFKVKHRILQAVRAIKLIHPDCVTNRQAV